VAAVNTDGIYSPANLQSISSVKQQTVTPAKQGRAASVKQGNITPVQQETIPSIKHEIITFDGGVDKVRGVNIGGWLVLEP